MVLNVPKVCKEISLNAVGLLSCWRCICNHWHHLEWLNVLLGQWLWILLWQQLLSLVEQILQPCLRKCWWWQLCPCCLPALVSLDFPCLINTSTPLPLKLKLPVEVIGKTDWRQPNGTLQSSFIMKSNWCYSVVPAWIRLLVWSGKGTPSSPPISLIKLTELSLQLFLCAVYTCSATGNQ